MLKPDYHHDSEENTFAVLLIPEKLIVDNIMGSYSYLGNPAASRKQLVSVWIRILRALIR